MARKVHCNCKYLIQITNRRHGIKNRIFAVVSRKMMYYVKLSSVFIWKTEKYNTFISLNLHEAEKNGRKKTSDRTTNIPNESISIDVQLIQPKFKLTDNIVLIQIHFRCSWLLQSAPCNFHELVLFPLVVLHENQLFCRFNIARHYVNTVFIFVSNFFHFMSMCSFLNGFKFA